MYFLLLFFGFLAGITTVLFGFGGGFVVVPVLYSVLLATHGGSAVGDAAMHVAVATSTCVMIFGAGLATMRHHKAGTVPWDQVRPLLGYIAVGAIPGAAAALALSGDWVRWAFIFYLGLTILDSILRPGFTQETAARIRPWGRWMTAAAGTAIGAIAAFLGVGGSVMTVPLMRRRGDLCAAGVERCTAGCMARGLHRLARLRGLGGWFMAGYPGHIEVDWPDSRYHSRQGIHHAAVRRSAGDAGGLVFSASSCDLSVGCSSGAPGGWFGFVTPIFQRCPG